MLLIAAQALFMVALLLAAAGLILERRTGKRQIRKATFVTLLTVLLLGAMGVLLALIGAALE